MHSIDMPPPDHTDLGSGGFGSVYLALDIKSNVNRALKKIKIKRTNNKSEQEIALDNIHRGQAEAQVMNDVYQILKEETDSSSSIIHTVQSFGSFINGTDFYIVMEYCEGGDLKHYIDNIKEVKNQNKDAKVSIENAWKIIRQIIPTLCILHDHGIIHSDLKPENILLTKDFQVKITDFGLAGKLLPGKDKMDFHGGTFNYYSPEIYSVILGERINKDILTIASDMWSCGIILFQLLMLRHPFISEEEMSQRLSSEEIGRRIKSLPPAELPLYYPKNMRDLIMRMLIKDPSQRITALEAKEILKAD
ncbi:MAG: putative serine/threonine protein kinase [Streblomastix strix]|uniref:non-specific serine/threonine protein kinase n=1 Tax=Streblomastix strix TaxID=222440 RepID=A0A5J4WM01_9EUKA|nr:MAG: putative serine/threonine protein kinase [Streblomastix strix]